MLLASATVVFTVRSYLREMALNDAAVRARLLLDRKLSIHNYFTQKLKPAVQSALADHAAPDYFAPEWMSSTYANRGIDQEFARLGGRPVYYKEAAINARSPENEADDYERSFLQRLQSSPDLINHTEVREVNGEPFLIALRRGETMTRNCLQCHSDPAVAPAQLVSRFGSQRSFGRKEGEVASALTIRLPLAEPFAAADRVVTHLSAWLLATIAGLTVINLLVTRQFVVSPLKRVTRKARQIATDTEYLGQQIACGKGRELAELAEAFNAMSTRLRQEHDQLEDAVQRRTAQLQESEQRYRLLAEHSLDLITRLTPDAVFTYVSPASRKMLGAAPEELLGRSAYDFVHPEDLGAIRSAHQQALTLPEFDTFIMRYRRKDGSYLHVEVCGHGVRDADGMIKEIHAVTRDVGERVEAAARTTRLLRQVISAQECERKRVARELHDETGQALSSLLMNLRAMEYAKSIEATRAGCGEMRHQISRLIEDVRRLAAGLMPSTLDQLGLAAALQQLVAECTVRYGWETNVDIEELAGIELQPEMAITLYRIVQETLTNAGRHAAATCVEITFRAEPGELELVIADNGRGFDPSVVPADGQPHFGLWSIQERAALLQGAVSIESAAGRGTTVSVRLPVGTLLSPCIQDAS